MCVRRTHTNQLPLFGSGKGPFASELSGFDEEAKVIKAEIEGLPSYVQWALSPAVRPMDLRGNDECAQRLRAVRHLMLRARGRSVLYGHPTPDMCVSRAFFSDGIVAELSASVVTVSKYHARLSDIKLCATRPDGLSEVRMPSKATLWHAGYERDPLSALALFHTMASGTTPVRFRVNVIWDSVTGLVHHLELLEILSAQDISAISSPIFPKVVGRPSELHRRVGFTLAR